MKPIATPAESAMIDRYMIETLEIPGILLMERAATALYEAVALMAPLPCRVLCIAGSGNNGGDAWAAGRILLTHGYDVRVGTVSLSLPPDANANMRFFTHTDRVTLLNEENLSAFFAQDAAVVLDGLLGTGLSRLASGLYAEIIRHINAHPAQVVSVDIPSGIFGETGAGDTAVKADCTVTFQYAKPGHLLYPGRAHTGRLVVTKIGVDEGRPPLEMSWADEYSLPKRDSMANKGNFGRLGIIAGSQGMAGAAILAAKGALAGGAGLTTVLSCVYVQDALQHILPTVMARLIGQNPSYIDASDFGISELSGYTALAAGPGLGIHAESQEFLYALAKADTPKVLDADALNQLALTPDRMAFGKNTVLTPHPKEFSRLSGLSLEEILAEPVACVRDFSGKFGVTLLLKGATTVVAEGGRVCLVTAGSPAMAKGGSGDVLTGVIGALLAQGISAFESAYGAAYLCGKAGEKAAAEMGEYAPTAEDTVRWIGK